MIIFINCDLVSEDGNLLKTSTPSEIEGEF